MCSPSHAPWQIHRAGIRPRRPPEFEVDVENTRAPEIRMVPHHICGTKPKVRGDWFDSVRYAAWRGLWCCPGCEVSLRKTVWNGIERKFAIEGWRNNSPGCGLKRPPISHYIKGKHIIHHHLRWGVPDRVIRGAMS